VKYLILLLLLSGCTSIYGDWKQVFHASEIREWHQVSRTQMYALCDIDARVTPNLIACGFQRNGRCDTFSFLSEAEAKDPFNPYGENVWRHEMKHCDGWRHPS